MGTTVKPGHSSLRPAKAPGSSPTILLVTADPGARGDQWPYAPGMYPNPGLSVSRSRGARTRRAAAIIGLAGLAVSVFGVAIALLPRHFTASQQSQIKAWEVMRRWQTMPAGQIFQ